MQAHNGTITLADLEAYKAIERKPLTGKYRGYDIVTAPPPSSGGVGILQMLGVLEGTGYEKGGAGSAEVVHYMTEAMRRFFADRNQWMGDPDFVKVPVKGMLDPDYIKKLRASIDPVHATPSSEVKPGAFTGHESFETTHFTVADDAGKHRQRDLHAERRLRQQGHGDGPGLPAEQRDGRFRGEAGRGQHVRAGAGRSQCHRAAQDAAFGDDADHRAERRQAVPGAGFAGRSHHHQHACSK